MIEFSDVMILTDADGDSIAEEIMVMRNFCFPERDNPFNDKDFGPFPDEIKEFCSTRPVGSTAVYKFNTTTQQMEEISPKYTNIGFKRPMQPECCPHGTNHGYANSCAPASITSGDFDGDERTDHILLYARRMEFFFSSDRPIGVLPIEKKYVGLTINLPPTCTMAYSIRLVDINKTGKQDIIVMCENIGTFLIYSRKNDEKDSWALRKDCNDNGSLGDIVFSSFNVTLEDFKDSCKNRDRFRYFNDLCESYESGEYRNPQHRGLTLADINNDGFTDMVVGSRIGYQKIFFYEPNSLTSRNRHISFRLIGDGKDVNLYGIGATMVILTKNPNSDKIKRQFREISSYQHITEKRGHQDEKIIFGLWKRNHPTKLLINWPNRAKQMVWLGEHDYATSIYPAIDVHYHNHTKFFRIRSKEVSDSGRQLCLKKTRGGGSKMKFLKLAECAAEGNPERKEHFSFNNWGMLKSRSNPSFCATLIKKSGAVRLTPCRKGTSKRNSWHETKDGFLRWSGSSKVMGVNRAAAGAIPRLLDMDMEVETQKWILEDVE